MSFSRKLHGWFLYFMLWKWLLKFMSIRSCSPCGFSQLLICCFRVLLCPPLFHLLMEYVWIILTYQLPFEEKKEEKIWSFLETDLSQPSIIIHDNLSQMYPLNSLSGLLITQRKTSTPYTNLSLRQICPEPHSRLSNSKIIWYRIQMQVLLIRFEIEHNMKGNSFK